MSGNPNPLLFPSAPSSLTQNIHFSTSIIHLSMEKFKKQTMPPKEQIPKTVNSLEEMTRKNQQHKSIQDDNLRIQGSTPKMKTSNAKQESTIQKQQD